MLRGLLWRHCTCTLKVEIYWTVWVLFDSVFSRNGVRGKRTAFHKVQEIDCQCIIISERTTEMEQQYCSRHLCCVNVHK